MFFKMFLSVSVACLFSCEVQYVHVREVVYADAGVDPAEEIHCGAETYLDGGFCLPVPRIRDSVVTCGQTALNAPALVLPGESTSVSSMLCRTRGRSVITSLRAAVMARLHTGEFVDYAVGEIPKAELLENGVVVAESGEPDEEGYLNFVFAQPATIDEAHEKRWTLQLSFGRTRRALVFYSVLFWSNMSTVSADSQVSGELLSTSSAKIGLTNAYPVITQAPATPAGAIPVGENIELAWFELSHRGRDIVLDPIIRVCLQSDNAGLFDIAVQSAYQVFGHVLLSRGECGDIAIAPFEVDILPETIWLTARTRLFESLNIVMRPRVTVWTSANGEQVNGLPSAPSEIVFPGLVVVP